MENHFKIPLLKKNGKPSIQEVKYTGEDGNEYTGLMFEGYANTVDKDRVGDIVLSESFLKQLPEYMTNSILLLQHNHNKPIGSIMEAMVDGKGLFVKGIVKVDTDNIFLKLRTGVIKTMSIGYKVIDYDVIEEGEGEDLELIKVIKQLDLYEVSLVGVPANTKARLKNISKMTEQEIKESYQVNKKDLYPIHKSISDAFKKADNINFITNNQMEQDNKEIKEEIIELDKKEEEITKEDIKKVELELEVEVEVKETEEQEQTEQVEPIKIEEVGGETEETEEEVEEKEAKEDIEIKEVNKQAEIKSGDTLNLEKEIAELKTKLVGLDNKKLETKLTDQIDSLKSKLDLEKKELVDTIIELSSIVEKSVTKVNSLYEQMSKITIRKGYQYESSIKEEKEDGKLTGLIKSIKSM